MSDDRHAHKEISCTQVCMLTVVEQGYSRH